MEFQKLHKLAEKYWWGNCTDREEQELRAALGYNGVPPGLEPLASYLRYQEAERTDTVLGEDFDRDILQKIAPAHRRKTRPLYYRIAAAIALILGVSIGIQQWSSKSPHLPVSEFADTYQDPNEAYHEVKKALMMVSTNMNQGMEKASMIGKFHQAHNELKQKKTIHETD